MKHFVGPWNIYNYKNEVRIFGEPHNRNIAIVKGTEQDASLIAAAPDLLEAGQELLEVYLDGTLDVATQNKLWIKLEKALRKAGSK